MKKVSLLCAIGQNGTHLVNMNIVQHSLEDVLIQMTARRCVIEEVPCR